MQYRHFREKVPPPAVLEGTLILQRCHLGQLHPLLVRLIVGQNHLRLPRSVESPQARCNQQRIGRIAIRLPEEHHREMSDQNGSRGAEEGEPHVGHAVEREDFAAEETQISLLGSRRSEWMECYSAREWSSVELEWLTMSEWSKSYGQLSTAVGLCSNVSRPEATANWEFRLTQDMARTPRIPPDRAHYMNNII